MSTLLQSTPACTVKEGAEQVYTFLTIPSGLHDRAAVAVTNQLTLEDTDRNLLKCRGRGRGTPGNRRSSRNQHECVDCHSHGRARWDQYQLSEIHSSFSPLESALKKKLKEKETEIAALQAHAANFQRLQKERARRVLELKRLENEMTKRLGDAGRLRPIQKFDDVLSGLGTHVVGFLTLVFAWGLLVIPSIALSLALCTTKASMMRGTRCVRCDSRPGRMP